MKPVDELVAAMVACLTDDLYELFQERGHKWGSLGGHQGPLAIFCKEGLNYISNILRVFDPKKHSFTRICLFGSEDVLSRMPDSPHIEKHAQPILDSLEARIRNHQYVLLNISRELCNKRPAPVSINSVWGTDLTFVRDHCGEPRPVMGVVDHGSRVCTRLAAVVNKRSWTLIGHLCLAIGQIESFFGRIKPFIGQIQIHSPAGLQNALNEMRHFFNHVRTHQNLAGLTPAEAWAGLTPTDLGQTPPKSTQLVQALDGLLVGHHIRR